MENAAKTAVFHHVPIMVDAVTELLRPDRGGVFVDGTLGGGGHSEAILQRLPEDGRLIGIDRDEAALAAATARLAPFKDRFTALHGNFFHMKSLLLGRGVTRADGILLDLGVSSYQLEPGRTAYCWTSACPPTSWTSPAGASPTRRRPPWTCAWTKPPPSPRRTW